MSKDEDPYLFMLRIPKPLKKEMAAHCKKIGAAQNAWVMAAIRTALYYQRGLPEPPQAFAPLPTPAEEIRAWAEGRKVLTPCGKQGECYGTKNPPVTYDGMSFCKECDIRVA